LAKESIQEIIEALKGGELVAIPTETVYGLAANALDPEAVGKIFEVKGRPLIDPLIVHVYDMEQVEAVAKDIPEVLHKLGEAFWPGPLTVVLKKREVVPDIVTAGKGTVAVRMPSHPVFRNILKEAGIPLAAPSANPFGYLSPTKAEHVKETLGAKVKHIVDGGACDFGVESTILDLSEPEKPKILRPGPITGEEIEGIIGIKPEAVEHVKLEGEAQDAPGLLESHYQPHARVYLMDSAGGIDASKEGFATVLLKRPEGEKESDTFWLSEDGDLREVAKNLFSLLHLLDKKGYKAIYIEKPANEGIGIAINNRLKKAQFKG